MDVTDSLDQAAAIQAERDAEERAQQPPEHESFDAFWSSLETAEAPRTETILGVEVTVPGPDRMTLRFRRQLDRLDLRGRDTTEDEVRQVVGDLFGADALDAWINAGMTERQFGVVMAWGIASAAGKEITWSEAYSAVVEGKAPARLRPNAAAASTPRSNGTGGRSKATSRRKGGRRKR